MTPQSQNSAIAQAVSFDLYVIVKRGSYYREDAHGYTDSVAEAWKLPIAEAKKYEMYADRDDVSVNEKVLLEKAPTPDYHGSLDAMHEAEMWLRGTDQQYFNDREYYDRFERYRTALVRFCGPCATAAERAELFLRNLNLWDDTK